MRLAHLPAIAAIALAVPAQFTSLASLRDQSRPLLIFSRSEADPRFQAETAILATNSDALIERNVIGLSMPLRGERVGLDSRIWSTPTADESATARHRFHVKPGEFVIILLGKDGDEKKRWHAPVAIEELRRNIDAMPMRRDEMRRSK